MSELEFEVGKFYTTRSGLKAECIATGRNGIYSNVFAVFSDDNSEKILTYDKHGRLIIGHEEDYDIVSEWKEKKKFFKSVDGEKAWQINISGRIVESCIWCGYENKFGLAFETKEDLEKHMEYLEASQKLKERIFELNDNEFPEWDWEDEKQEKYHLAKSKGKLTDLFTTTLKCFDNWFYLKTEDARDRLLEEMPRELMIFLSQ